MTRLLSSLPHLLLLVLLTAATPGRAQAGTLGDAEAEVARIQTDFEYGKFAEVQAASEVRLDRGGLSDAARLELHKLAGLAAFALDHRPQAERHFRSVLRLDPDYSLDPFRVPPPALGLYERVRAAMAEELAALRAEKTRRLERQRQEEEDRQDARDEVEAMRRQLDELTRQVTVRTVERRPFLLNFVPFGMGQFQQGRTGLGVALAVSQGALAATSLAAYITRGTLRERKKEVYFDRKVPGGVYERWVTVLPDDRRHEDETWTYVQFGSAAGFYGLLVFGVVDAILQHQDEVVSSTSEPGLLPEAARPAPGPSLSLQPLPGGLSAGFSLRF